MGTSPRERMDKNPYIHICPGSGSSSLSFVFSHRRGRASLALVSETTVPSQGTGFRGIQLGTRALPRSSLLPLGAPQGLRPHTAREPMKAQTERAASLLQGLPWLRSCRVTARVLPWSPAPQDLSPIASLTSPPTALPCEPSTCPLPPPGCAWST